MVIGSPFKGQQDDRQRNDETDPKENALFVLQVGAVRFFCFHRFSIKEVLYHEMPIRQFFHKKSLLKLIFACNCGCIESHGFYRFNPVNAQSMFLRFRKTGKLSKDHQLSDPELMAKYRATVDPEVIAVLFQRYTHLVYGVCRKYLEDQEDAKDAVMEIFEGLFDSLLIHDIQHFKSWLYSVTRNHCLMKLRKRKDLHLDMELMQKNSGDVFMENEDPLHLNEVFTPFHREDVISALSVLNTQQQQCIGLFYLEEKSYKEISEMTGYTLKEVKSHIQNGKRNLKIYLEKKHVRET